MIILKKPKFERVYKKLHTNQLVDVNKAIQEIVDDPYIGQQKLGDLNWLRVHKFKMVKQLTLIGYYIEENGDLVLTLIALGSHENFYRDIKNS
jgi:hypothetical protein